MQEELGERMMQESGGLLLGFVGGSCSLVGCRWGLSVRFAVGGCGLSLGIVLGVLWFVVAICRWGLPLVVCGWAVSLKFVFDMDLGLDILSAVIVDSRIQNRQQLQLQLTA